MNTKIIKLLLLTGAVSLSVYGISAIYYRFILKKINPVGYQLYQLKNQISAASYEPSVIVELKIKKNVILQSKGLVFNLKLLQDLDKKPQGSKTVYPFLKPFEQGLYICDILSQHRLLFNKFAVEKNHLLVVTTQFEEQTGKLNLQDFTAAAYAIRAVGGFAFFNGGANSGASQPHRHIQIMSKKCLKESQLLNFYKKSIKSHNYQDFVIEIFPFRHIVKVFDPMSEYESVETSGDKLNKAYNEALIYLKNEDLQISYNLIFTSQFLFIVLRSKEVACELLAINGMGFAGSFLVKQENILDQIKTIDPIKILSDVCLL